MSKRFVSIRKISRFCASETAQSAGMSCAPTAWRFAKPAQGPTSFSKAVRN